MEHVSLIGDNNKLSLLRAAHRVFIFYGLFFGASFTMEIQKSSIFVWKWIFEFF